MASDFEWTSDNEAVPVQARTAAYFNEDGELVIRQENESRGEDDIIVIARANMRGLIDKLYALVNQAAEEDRQIADGKGD